MAKVIFGVGVQGMSGSVNRKAGGSTFQKNNVVRQRVIPVQPLTTEQARVKNMTSVLAAAWGQTLTPEQRIAWNDAAISDAWNFQDGLTGTTRKVSGFNLFFAINANINFLLQTAALYASNVPVKTQPGTTNFASVTAVASTGAVTATYTGTFGTDENHIFLFSAPQPPGRMKFRASKISYLTMNTTVSPVSLTEYVAKFGAITAKEGYNIYYKVLASTDSGLKRVAGQGVIQITA